MRTDGSRGTYVWWYFDAHLDDVAKLVVVFLTKEFADINKPLSPAIRIDLTLPDGTVVVSMTLSTATSDAAARPTSLAAYAVPSGMITVIDSTWP